jgi:hypothetical protein
MHDWDQSTWELEIVERVDSAETLRDLVDGTVGVMDSWLEPIIEKEIAKYPLPWQQAGSPKDRFDHHMAYNDVQDDRESGHGLYFRILAKAYSLHAGMASLTDAELLAAARDTCAKIITYSPNIAPPWLGRDRDATCVPPEAILRIDSPEDVLEHLRAWFRDALAYAHGYCETYDEVAADGTFQD